MKRRGRRWRGAIVALGLIPAWWIVAPMVRAAPQKSPAAKVLYHRNRSFRIPVTIDADARPLVREVRLWVSDDTGFTWKEYGRTSPDRPEFPFKAPRDGEFWFAVQTLDTKGRIYPSDDRTAEPTLKVIVDTTLPTMVLSPRGRRGSQVSVRWEVRDENLVVRSLTLEYQAEGARDWRQVPLREADFTLIGAKTWDAATADPIRVRGSIRDRANNLRTVEITLPDGLAANPGGSSTDPRDGSEPPPISPITARSNTSTEAPGLDDDPFASSTRGAAKDPGSIEPGDPPIAPNPAAAAPGGGGNQTLLVSSPRFPLQYSVEDAGPEGPSLVELWLTRDGGRTWSRQPPDSDRVSPYQVDAGGEGTIGLWLVVQGASGLGDPPPAPGDRPQIWVEVDSTPPSLQLDPPKVGTGAQAGKLFLSWRASDAHLDSRPVLISYRPDRPEATWQPITDRLENTGRYTWTVPPSVPARFHMKIEVVDTLGNRAAAETTDTGPVIVDRTRPRGRIIGLDPSAQNGSDARSRQ